MTEFRHAGFIYHELLTEAERAIVDVALLRLYESLEEQGIEVPHAGTATDVESHSLVLLRDQIACVVSLRMPDKPAVPRATDPRCAAPDVQDAIVKWGRKADELCFEYGGIVPTTFDDALARAKAAQEAAR